MSHFITHDVCPKGFQLEVDHDKGECSVMHWKYQRCQRCKALPPEGILALYLLTIWETPMTMEEWETPMTMEEWETPMTMEEWETDDACV